MKIFGALQVKVWRLKRGFPGDIHFSVTHNPLCGFSSFGLEDDNYGEGKGGGGSGRAKEEWWPNRRERRKSLNRELFVYGEAKTESR